MGAYEIAGADGIRGVEIALKEHGHRAGGHDIEIQIEGTNAIPDSATRACETLINQGVQLFIGPLSGNEAIAVREIANAHPDFTFVCGAAGSQPHFNPAENFFMFNPTGAQLLSGLGKYAHDTLGYKRIATIGEAYSFPFAQIGGFALDFINAGGTISEYLWCSLGTKDYTDYINQIPNDVDAIFSSLGGSDGLDFIEQFREKRSDLPLIAGSIFADQSCLSSLTQHSEFLTGIVSSSTHADDMDSDLARKFIKTYQTDYPDAFYAPSFFALAYYINTKALLLALDAVNGDLSKLQDALRTLKFETPIGSTHLDHHRVAVMDTVINEIKVTDAGNLYTALVKKVPQTTSTLGMSDDEFIEKANFGVYRMPGLKQNKTFADILVEQKRKNK